MGRYKIAGLIVEMDSFGKTVEQAKPYLVDTAGDPDIIISSNWQRFKEKHPELSDESCEYLCTGSYFYKQIVNFNGIMIHSSAVVMDGKAYLFTAPCGTGKSTHIALWKKAFGDSVHVVNGDKPIVREINGEFLALTKIDAGVMSTIKSFFEVE